MNQEIRDALRAQRRYMVLECAKASRNVAKECREFEVPRSSFYRWRKAYEAEGWAGLLRKRPVARSHPRQIPPEYVE